MNRAAEELLGSTRNELLGRVLWEVYPPILGTGVEQAYRSVAELRRPATFENYYAPWDRWFELRAQPNDDGGVSVFFQDVLARKQFEEERESLLSAERSARSLAEREGRIKDEFLATLSHELRTPLNAVLGYSALLRMSKSDEAQVQEAAETIERNARAQAQLIEDLLDMNRIVSGKLRLDVQQLELTSIIQAALETVRPSAEAKGIRVQVVLDPLAGPVRGDANRLQQVIWNLLANAIKFTPKEGKVQVALERVNSHLEVAVADTGIGIEPDFLPRVFDRFRQADPSTTRQFGGLGLGLSIVKHLVELHGGSVRAKSPGTGLGATFVVALPLAVVHPEELAHERVHPRTSPGLTAAFRPDLTGVRVLAVDDDADAGALIKRILTDCGAEVVVAQSASAALEHFQAAEFQVLVSDIGMPGEDGYSLIRKVRAWERDRGSQTVPAMALTAFARSEDRQRAALAGFQTHLAKPVEPAELLALVASLAGRTDCL